MKRSRSRERESNFVTILLGVHAAIPVKVQVNSVLTKSDPTPVVYAETFNCPYDMCIVISKANPLEKTNIEEIDPEELKTAKPEKYKCIRDEEEYSIIERKYESVFTGKSFLNDSDFFHTVSELNDILNTKGLDYFMTIYKKGDIMIQKELIYDSEPSDDQHNFKNEIIAYSGYRRYNLNPLKNPLRESQKARADGGYNLSVVLDYANLNANSPYCLLIDSSCFDWRVFFMSDRQERHAKQDVHKIIRQIKTNHDKNFSNLMQRRSIQRRSIQRRSKRRRVIRRFGGKTMKNKNR